MITEKGNNLHWNYFLALDDDAANLARYVEFSNANFNTYSIEMARLLMAASSEVDVVAKMLCKIINPNSSAKDINDYRTAIMSSFPAITDYTIVIPRFGLELLPWQNWSSNKNPDWWRDYNSVKHERNSNYTKANLSNTLNSIAGLFSILLFCFKEDAENGDLLPIPKMFSVPPGKFSGVSIDSKGLTYHYNF